ncbi:MAG: hypothetical protein JW757_06500 [Anaerolineales bacterium]|nr:hypothetical protein [Anaerolineales bacterium]
MAEESIHLPYSPDLAATGVQEVLYSLTHPARHLFFHSFDAMRLRAANNIVSLAFRRYLADQDVPHQFAASLSFTEADRYELSIGGRRCIPVAQLVCGDQTGEEMLYLLDQHGRTMYRDVDIYLFFYLFGSVTRSRDETDAALFSGQPVCLVHQTPESWASPEHWDGLGRLVVKSDSSAKVNLGLHGLDQQRGYRRYAVAVPPRKRIVVESSLHALGAVTTQTYPTGPVGLFSPILDDLHLIYPHTWGNIWVYGQKITGLGYITKANFDRQVRKLSGSELASPNPCLGEEETLCIRRSALTPLEDLFQRAREWMKN